MFARKRGVRQNGVGLSRNGRFVIFYWGLSGDSEWCSIGKKTSCVYLSFVNKHLLQNNCLNKTWGDCRCNSVDTYNNY